MFISAVAGDTFIPHEIGAGALKCLFGDPLFQDDVLQVSAFDAALCVFDCSMIATLASVRSVRSSFGIPAARSRLASRSLAIPNHSMPASVI